MKGSRVPGRVAQFSLTPRIFKPNSTLPSTVFHGKSVCCWKTTPRSAPGLQTDAFHPLAASPAVSRVKPAIAPMIVDLPQPDGPSTLTNEPGANIRVYVAHRIHGILLGAEANAGGCACGLRLCSGWCTRGSWLMRRLLRDWNHGMSRWPISLISRLLPIPSTPMLIMPSTMFGIVLKRVSLPRVGADSELARDHFRSDERKPRCSHADAQTGDDGRQRTGENHLAKKGERSRSQCE